MKVILLEDISNLGTAGEVVTVKRGFGMNYLLPEGKAEMVTKSRLNEVETHKAAIRKKAEHFHKRALEVKTQLESYPLVIKMKTGETGRLYGAVTGMAIVKAVKEQTNIEIEKRDVTIPIPIKEQGTYKVNVKLHPEVVADIKVTIEQLKD
jgi:large subunit ribosomal protein L9